MKQLRRGLFVVLAVAIGLYPIGVFFMPAEVGLPSTKPTDLLASSGWWTAFYAHITFGGLALLSGFSQFSAPLRAAKPRVHRVLGTIYVVSCLISGVAGLVLAPDATTGLVAAFGFGLLALAWLTSTVIAWRHILARRITQHQHWMVRSFALTFAAVTLRLWMPTLTSGFGMSFFDAYPMIAWLCWVPNLLVAEWIVRRAQ